MVTFVNFSKNWPANCSLDVDTSQNNTNIGNVKKMHSILLEIIWILLTSHSQTFSIYQWEKSVKQKHTSIHHHSETWLESLQNHISGKNKTCIKFFLLLYNSWCNSFVNHSMWPWPDTQAQYESWSFIIICLIGGIISSVIKYLFIFSHVCWSSRPCSLLKWKFLSWRCFHFSFSLHAVPKDVKIVIFG